MNKIKFENVSKAYSGGRQALSEVSLELIEGEVTFLTGHSGAGKSSLLKLIMRDQLATDGVVSVNGVDLASIKDRATYLIIEEGLESSSKITIS